MNIEKFILREFKRFRLRQIRYFEYTPGKKTQAILGSNGSGKSSLLEELSPLPANSKSFNTGGGKELWITHRGRKYHLNSQFTEDGNIFSFELDGVELNDGHTVTGYRELVKEHFNYTKEIHAVLIGKVKFTSMSVNERRNWFTLISQLDYDYAVGFYKRIKEQIRGLQGALNRTQERLAQETALLLPDEEITRLHKNISDEKEKLDLLLNNKPSFHGQFSISDMQRSEQSLGAQISTVEALIKAYQEIGTQKPIEELYALKNKLIAGISALGAEVKAAQQTVMNIQQQMNEYSGLEGINLDAMRAEVSKIEQEIEVLVNSRVFGGLDSKVAYEPVREMLYHQLELIEGLLDVNGTAVELEAMDQQLAKYSTAIQQAEKLTELTKIRIKEFEVKRSEGEAACPRCDHRWIPNYDPNEHQRMISDLTRTDERIQELKLKGTELSAKRSRLKQYLDLRVSFSFSISKNPGLSGLWSKLMDLVDDREIFFSDVTRARFLIEQAGQEIRNEARIEVLNATLFQHRKIISIAEAAEKRDKTKLIEHMGNENLKLAMLSAKYTELAKQFESTSEEIMLLERIAATYKTCQEKSKEHLAQGKQVVLRQLSMAMQEASYQHAMLLSNYEKQRSQIDLRKNVIASLNTEVVELRTEIALLQLSEGALSPSTGLIAKGMTNFINEFVSGNNETIASVWLYPLSIRPIEMASEDELDYRFTVQVNGEDASPDVSEVSEGMKEIINLAFMLTSMHFLGLEDYPVFLDEFAVKMDAAHRDAAYAVIDHLAESSLYSQLFLISHYESGYANLADAEITVLCPANITIPKTLVYNQNCVIG